MFKLSNPQAINVETTVGFRIGTNDFIYLPLDREARNALSKVAEKEIDEAVWLTPYGDMISLNEVDYGLYDVALNNELVAARVRADDVAKVVAVIETGRAMIAARKYRKLPTRADVDTNVRIGVVVKTSDNSYTLLSLGRIQPTQLFELKKYGWEISQTHKIKTEDGEVTIQAYTGLGAAPVLVDGNPVSVSELIAELEEHEVACYALRDLR